MASVSKFRVPQYLARQKLWLSIITTYKNDHIKNNAGGVVSAKATNGTNALASACVVGNHSEPNQSFSASEHFCNILHHFVIFLYFALFLAARGPQNGLFCAQNNKHDIFRNIAFFFVLA
eukprot:GEMP01035624.1.p1 GENE.GEMP01035624.1~~GEMP01035624.1.p1  ORF type:complete len:120 (+),score=0.37 GEMP01035624.1:125-484(+)